MTTDHRRLRFSRWLRRALTAAVLSSPLIGAAAALALRIDSPTTLHHATTCAFLTRAGSIGTVGQPGPQETINVLAYPVPAQSRLLGLSGPGGNRSTSQLTDEAGALFDECAGGWRAPTDTSLPLALEIHIAQEGAHIQR